MAAVEVMSRRSAMRAIFGAASMPAIQARAAGAQPWETSLPSNAGFSHDLPDRLDAGARSGQLPGVHAVLVSRDDRLVLERYFRGPDQLLGRPLGTIDFGPDTLHDLRSVTKSVVGLLYGIALDRGLVPPPDAPLLAQFPEYPDLAADPARAAPTIVNALTMTMGFAWDEQRSYADPTNSERAMEDARDRNRYVLEQPVIAAPGMRWIYSGGAVALLGTLIARGAGMALQQFARQALFKPLGIEQFEWTTGRDGVASAAAGLRLRPRDLLRIGTLVLGNGQADGRQVVSRGWLERSFKPAIGIGDGLEYGRLWYLGEVTTPALAGPRRSIGAHGNGGQRLWLLPDAGLAVAILCGNYNAGDQRSTPLRIWREIVLANLLRV